MLKSNIGKGIKVLGVKSMNSEKVLEAVKGNTPLKGAINPGGALKEASLNPGVIKYINNKIKQADFPYQKRLMGAGIGLVGLSAMNDEKDKGADPGEAAMGAIPTVAAAGFAAHHLMGAANKYMDNSKGKSVLNKINEKHAEYKDLHDQFHDKQHLLQNHTPEQMHAMQRGSKEDFLKHNEILQHHHDIMYNHDAATRSNGIKNLSDSVAGKAAPNTTLMGSAGMAHLRLTAYKSQLGTPNEIKHYGDFAAKNMTNGEDHVNKVITNFNNHAATAVKDFGAINNVKNHVEHLSAAGASEGQVHHILGNMTRNGMDPIKHLSTGSFSDNKNISNIVSKTVHPDTMKNYNNLIGHVPVPGKINQVSSQVSGKISKMVNVAKASPLMTDIKNIATKPRAGFAPVASNVSKLLNVGKFAI